MGIEINISNTKINDNARIMNDAVIKGTNDVKINLQDSDISGRAEVLERLEINPVLQALAQEAKLMDKDSAEYSEIQEILGTMRWNRKDFIERIARHIGEFSQGVLASIVANLLT